MRLVLTLSFLLLYVCLWAQSQVVLRHKKHHNRTKEIRTDKLYTVQTRDSTLIHINLTAANDSTLNLMHADTGDIMHIPIADIEYLRKESTSGFFEGIAYTGAILLSITPIVWVFEGGEEALGTLEGVGLLAAISVPVILLKNVGRKKDTVRHWDIVIPGPGPH